MPRQLTKLTDKDFKLLKKEGMDVLGETGALFPTFGNDTNDFVKFYIYDLNDTYLKSGVSEDFTNDGDDIKLNPGNDLRRIGFTRGDYKIKYFFYRRMAGADEVVLTKTVGDQSGIIHSSNTTLTGVPMGSFYVDEDGKVFQGERPPVDGTEPQELDVKEYKFFIDEISADRTEIRLVTQAINLDRYKDEFYNLLSEGSVYVPDANSLYGKGKFPTPDRSEFEFEYKKPNDTGFIKKFKGGILQVERAFTTGHDVETNTTENPDWSLEDPIPVITIESNYPDLSVVTNTEVTFTAKRENGNEAPSNLSYYWDFGCGHTKIGGPVGRHTYTKSGNFSISLVINSPNFVRDVDYDTLKIRDAINTGSTDGTGSGDSTGAGGSGSGTGNTDSGPIMKTLSLNIKAFIGGEYNIPYDIDMPDDQATSIDAYFRVNGTNHGRTFSSQYEEGTTVTVEVIDDSSPSDVYGLIRWKDQDGSNPEARQFILNNNISKTALVGISF
ncbi:PKD domain-containing protein [bacterium]|nr:PKD domain-containing protein [bacterium]